MSDLTPKQERFCEEYLIDMNATQAAIRAGYSSKGATVRGSELLANRKVMRYVNELRAKTQERVMVTVESLTAELDEARRIAMEQEDAGELRQNTMAKAKLHGLDVHKIDANVGFKVSIDGDDAKL